MKFEMEKLLRDNIRRLKPYSSARDEFSGEAEVYLDANENPFNDPWNRYPDPRQVVLKKRVAEIKKIPPENIFLGNGSDEPIDLMIRAFCEPGKDNIVSISPTYGMYKVAADVNNIAVTEVPLTEEFGLVAGDVLQAVNESTRIIFLCSPNNPSGNALDRGEMIRIIRSFSGIVILDEAYIDFCPEKSFLPELGNYSNLIVLQTFSKAWGMAGLRLGMAFGNEDIIEVLSRIKYPYNLSVLTQEKAMELLREGEKKTGWVETLLKERDFLRKKLSQLPVVQKVFPSDSNFLLVKTRDPKGIYRYLVGRNIIVRDRSNIRLCEGCLRISVGSHAENVKLTKALEEFNEGR